MKHPGSVPPPATYPCPALQNTFNTSLLLLPAPRTRFYSVPQKESKHDPVRAAFCSCCPHSPLATAGFPHVTRMTHPRCTHAPSKSHRHRRRGSPYAQSKAETPLCFPLSPKWSPPWWGPPRLHALSPGPTPPVSLETSQQLLSCLQGCRWSLQSGPLLLLCMLGASFGCPSAFAWLAPHPVRVQTSPLQPSREAGWGGKPSTPCRDSGIP